MSADGSVPVVLVFGCLLVLARILSAFVFVPIPGIKSAPDEAKIGAAFVVTISLFALWPQVPADTPISTYVVWLCAEAAFGVTVGVITALATEGFLLAAQIIGLQAGFSYASTIDPTTQSDSTVLQTLVQLFAGLLFFAAGIDREVLRTFARSLETWPPGSFSITPSVWEIVRPLSAAMFTTGIRLALPVIAFLLLIDLSLALLGRINSQLQLLTLAFPFKMLAGLVTIGALVSIFPLLFQESAARALNGLGALLR